MNLASSIGENTPKRTHRLSIRSLLIGINLVVLLLPLAGIQLMRLYESALVRQTESALIAQGAFVAAFYRSLVREEMAEDWQRNSRALPQESGLMRDGRWYPQPPTLDLTTSEILAPFPDGIEIKNESLASKQVSRRMSTILKDAQLVTLAGIRVADPWGVVVASTGEDVGLSIHHSEEFEAAIRGRPASRLRRKSEIPADASVNSFSRTSRIRVFVSSPIILMDRLIGVVLLSRTPPSIVQALYAKRWLLLQGLFLLVVLVIVMSLLTFRLIARPISHLAEQADQITKGRLSSEIGLQEQSGNQFRTKEIAQLQIAIADMATNLEQRASYLQQFTRHLSHEFKTPLAGIRGAIEVMQDHAEDMDEVQRMRFLSNVADDADRLNRLTERLLDLSKAEIDTPIAETVDLHSLIENVARPYLQTFIIDLENLHDDVNVKGDQNIIRAVIEVLIENAAQHGATHLKCWSTRNHQTTQLLIQDNGSGISSSNRERIFTPFFTTQREHGGTGLGLTIAQALMKQIDGSIALELDQQATTFKLIFATENG